MAASALTAQPVSDAMADQLVSWGRVVMIETRGRTSGRAVSTAVGFIEEPDGSLLVAAGEPDTHWARNLLADPLATARLGERSWPVAAEELHGPQHQHAIRELILRYGTPAEGLGRGPSFRLRPVDGGH